MHSRSLSAPFFTLLLTAAPLAANEPFGPSGPSSAPGLYGSAAHTAHDGPVDPAALPSLSWTSGRPDGHAPIGVMGDHIHHAGGWMLSLRFMSMLMDGNLDGTESVSSQQVLDQGYMVAPTKMSMTMAMLGGMYAPSDDLTLLAMVPYYWKDMDHVTAMGGSFSTSSQGLGDVKVGGLYRFWERGRQTAHLNLYLSTPTGSIDEEGVTPMSMGNEVQLPYPMQLGSGTWDLMPGLTYLGQADHWSWGGQAIFTLRTGTNSNDYTLGDRTELTAWGAWRASQRWSLSLRAAGSDWGNISGADPALNPAVVPTADPNKRGGRRLDLLVGANFLSSGGHRLAIEVGAPVYQDLDGPQLGVDLLGTIGYQYAW